MEFLQSIASDVWAVFLIVLFFGGSIFVHELGHFLAARWRGARVERFSIGFGPALWLRRGQDGVEYRLSCVPLGGYVLLPQLADMGGLEGESSAEAGRLPPLGYLSKMLILVAGVVYNVIFAFVLACGLWMLGQPVTEEEQTTQVSHIHATLMLPDGKEVPGPAYVAGLKPGDFIREVDGQSVHSFNEIAYLVALGTGRGPQAQPMAALTIERDGQQQVITLVPAYAGPEGMRDIGVEPGVKVAVYEVSSHSAAEEAGLKAGDIITQLDGQPVNYPGFIAEYVRQVNGRPVQLTYLRDGQAHTVAIEPRLTLDPATKTTAPRLGIVVHGATTSRLVHLAPWTQLKNDILSTWRLLTSLLNRHSDIGPSKLSGPVGIVRGLWISAKSDYPIRAALEFAIMINISLASFNLLPIPVLDGGQMLFATIGRVRGRVLPANFIIAAQSVSLVLLMTLVLYVTFFDLRR